MIVFDASAMVEALVGKEATPELFEALSQDIHAPHLLDIEVLSVLRGLVRGNIIILPAAEEAKDTFNQFNIERHDIASLSDRIWTLRHQFTAYDASYIALAEALDCDLVTRDTKLATNSHTASVLVLPRRAEQ